MGNDREMRRRAHELSIANMRACREQIMCLNCQRLTGELIELSQIAFERTCELEDAQVQLKKVIEIYSKREAMQPPAPIILEAKPKE